MAVKEESDALTAPLCEKMEGEYCSVAFGANRGAAAVNLAASPSPSVAGGAKYSIIGDSVAVVTPTTFCSGLCSRVTAVRMVATLLVLLNVFGQLHWNAWAPPIFVLCWFFAPLSNANVFLLLPWAGAAWYGVRWWLFVQFFQMGMGPFLFMLAEFLEASPTSLRRPLRSFALRLRLPSQCYATAEVLSDLCPPLHWAYVLIVELSLLPPLAPMVVLSRLLCPAPGVVGTKSVVADTEPLAVLVHGNGINEGQWVIGRIILALAEIPVVRINYLEAGPLCTEAPSTHGVFQVASTFRNAMINAGLARRPCFLVGHSLGSLVCTAFVAALTHEDASMACAVREYGRKLPPAEAAEGSDCASVRARHVVSAVSGPFHGSDLLGWIRHRGLDSLLWPCGFPELMRDLGNETACLQKIRSWRDVIAGSSITGSLDPIVRPYSARFDCPPALRPPVVLPFCGHYCIAASRSFWELVVCHFEGEFRKPAAAAIPTRR
eukprot:TRINITY_DN16104_c0_g1_i1.p1 TRINITY_DN16104_c0_g1~~TRINITY_DN16104_c0_g1_i1.p1  ORF type:complete len:491 (-),score=63.64 TRINITY_DN16104_c0_g1_i1:35-1507(-)